VSAEVEVARDNRFRRGDERGAISLFVAMGMVAFLGCAAIAIDMGYLMNVRTESQRVADLAALAGASAFIDAKGGAALQSTIEARAIEFAALNTVDRTPVGLTPADIAIDFANERVRVTIRNTAATGNPIRTVFARSIGIHEVDVVTTAVAEAFPATTAKCILPFMLPDSHRDGGGDPNLYDHENDYYEPHDPSVSPPAPSATGYTDGDIGTPILIKPGNRNKSMQPNSSWYYPVVMLGSGASRYQAAIESCPDVELTIGDIIDVEPGAMIGPTREGIENLVAQAPNHYWSTSHNCVIDGGPGGSPNVCVPSPRLRAVPMLAPPDAPNNGRKSVSIMNWAGVFVEGMGGENGEDVLGRFAGYSGLTASGGGAGGSGALLKVIRLVE